MPKLERAVICPHSWIQRIERIHPYRISKEEVIRKDISF